MNEIKKCSLSGIGFTFESEAYNRLSDYLKSLKEAYRNNDGCDEILADIEARIAELILSAQSDAQRIVALPLVENIIAQLGTPEAITGEEPTATAADDSTTHIPRRLYRDLENAKLGGVCAGLAKHFGVDAVWIRLAIFSPFILFFVGNIPAMHWCYQIGGNLFGIFLLTYLILWFAIPGAKSARQKLEMEGEPISARSIAYRQAATPEERAKSSVASAVAVLGRVMIVVVKIALGLLLFPITAGIFGLLISIVGIFTGFEFIEFGSFGNMSEVVTEIGEPLLFFSLSMVLVPVLYVGYLLITLLINKKPRWWVLFATILVWIILLFGTIFAGIDYAENRSFASFSSDSEVERIMKRSDNANDLSRQIMEQLNSEPDAEQRAEIERLLHDKNAQSID
ncbi:MAG: PspC domain-containing protein [Alistipes sp.]|nr:PspC domain-containing protein [Alistipes sp.]